MSEIKCLKCKSSNIHIDKKGYSLTKGVGGALLTGGVGLLAGLHGKNNLEITCLSCGNKWSLKDHISQSKKIDTQKSIEEFDNWRISLDRQMFEEKYFEAIDTYSKKYPRPNSIEQMKIEYTKMVENESKVRKSNFFSLVVFLVSILVIIFMISKCK